MPRLCNLFMKDSLKYIQLMRFNSLGNGLGHCYKLWGKMTCKKSLMEGENTDWSIRNNVWICKYLSQRVKSIISRDRCNGCGQPGDATGESVCVWSMFGWFVFTLLFSLHAHCRQLYKPVCQSRNIQMNFCFKDPEISSPVIFFKHVLGICIAFLTQNHRLYHSNTTSITCCFYKQKLNDLHG